MNFVHQDLQVALKGARKQIANLRRWARAWPRDARLDHVYVVCRETEKEAQDYWNYYVQEKGDWVATGNLLHDFRPADGDLRRQNARGPQGDFIAGHGGYPLVGTAAQIVDELGKLADIGVDGCLLSWVEYKSSWRSGTRRSCR